MSRFTREERGDTGEYFNENLIQQTKVYNHWNSGMMFNSGRETSGKTNYKYTDTTGTHLGANELINQTQLEMN